MRYDGPMSDNRTSLKQSEMSVARVDNNMTPFQEYIDYSTKSPEWVESEWQRQWIKIQRANRAAKGPFPMKLFDMLEDIEECGFLQVISFQPHGRALRIHSPQRFEDDILPRYFPDNKNIESFLRQLNIYGFRRMINTGPDRDSYYHAMFLRGRPDLCSLMERPSTSQHSKRKKYDPMTEPNFYSVPSIQSLPADCESNLCHDETILQDIKIEESEHPRKRQRTTLQENCPNDRIVLPQSAAKAPHFQNNLNNVSPAHEAFAIPCYASTCNDGFHRHSSTAMSNGHKVQGDHNRSLRSDVKSDNDVTDATVLSSVSDTPIASFIYSKIAVLPVPIYKIAPTTASNIHYQNKNIPVSVVTAARSLLATQDDARLSIDSTSSIVEEYCLNLAIDVLQQSCCQIQTPPNHQDGESQRLLQQYNDTHHQTISHVPVESLKNLISSGSLEHNANIQHECISGAQFNCDDSSGTRCSCSSIE